MKQVKTLLFVFIILLFLSGLTAMPIHAELSYLLNSSYASSSIHYWLATVLSAYDHVQANYPFLLYGYDWLAFAHFVLAILFIGPYIDPVKNIWVIKFGLLACVLVVPFALIAGYYRNIPFWWRLIDCSFGLIGFLVLWACYKKIINISNDKNQKA